MDEDLLKSLDATSEVKRKGRSAVLRAAISDYLSRLEQEEIRKRYQQAYAGESGLGKEFDNWEEQGEWPAE